MNYHFIGLGGIGMSALARILLQKGKKVQGSDAKESSLLDQLEREGAKVQIGHDRKAIAAADTVIYSTDIKEDNVEIQEAREKKLPLLHRSDLLDFLMQGKKNLLVTGTHGKTTTSALLAWVLLEAGLDPSFVVGGLIRSLNTNGRGGEGDYFVAEADESDGSFLKTAAYSAIVTNLENDHLEYWGSERMLDLAFKQFIAQTENLFWCADDPRLSELKPHGKSYGFLKGADFQISHFRQTQNGILFDLNEFQDIHLNLLGRHNALNGAAVFALALSLKIPEEAIRLAFRKFSGTARRLDFRGEKHKVALYDDYGHHPNEIKATLKALRDHVGERRLVVVFQPHRYSRVRDLFEGFASCFEDADEVFMTDIYSAGEKPIEGISSAALYTRLREKLASKLHFIPRQHLEAGVAPFLRPFDVLITIGAGDITKAGDPILSQYAEKGPKWTVAVLFGGTSAEHPVSLMSAKNIIAKLDPEIYNAKLFGITKEGEWIFGFDVEKKSNGPKISPEILQELLTCDVAIPILHGPQGEDGMAGALLDSLFIPYVGCDYRSGAICMQKAWTKYVALNCNVPTAPFIEMDRVSYQRDPEALAKKIDERFPYPVWVKPVHLGSSIGVSRASDRSELSKCVDLALHYDEVFIVEKEIEGRQIEFSLLGNEIIRIAPPAEIVNYGSFVAYDKKYGTAAMEIQSPAPISETEKEVGYELAERIYRACRCKGLARVDFFLDRQGHYWLNEINPFPGFTETSAYPKAWEAGGLSLKELIDELMILAFQRSRVVHRTRGKQ